jgi:putative addiction module component (TIGR02574 family)
MNLDYENKVSSSELLNPAGAKKIKDLSGVDLSKEKINRILFSGNNLEVMQSLVAHHDMSGKVDLVYIDPPFASQIIFELWDALASNHAPIELPDEVIAEAHRRCDELLADPEKAIDDEEMWRRVDG